MQRVFARRGMQRGRLMGSDAAGLRHGNDQQGIHAGTGAKAVVPACEIAERASAELREAIADFFGQRAEIGCDHLWLSVETSAEFFVLRGNADRAGVEMALASHHAADREERGGAETEFVCAKECANDNIARKFQAPIDTERDTRTEPCADQRVVRFAETDFPRQARVFDGRERRRAGTTVVAADGDDVGSSFGNTCGDDSHACAAHELHADARAGIDGAQVMDKLCQVFDAVNIVMRRRRNERGAGRRVADARDVFGDFARRELAAFAGLGALRHFDFELFGMNQIIRGDAESARGNLLDLVGRGGLKAVGVGIFAAFAGVAASADHIHG